MNDSYIKFKTSAKKLLPYARLVIEFNHKARLAWIYILISPFPGQVLQMKFKHPAFLNRHFIYAVLDVSVMLIMFVPHTVEAQSGRLRQLTSSQFLFSGKNELLMGAAESWG